MSDELRPSPYVQRLPIGDRIPFPEGSIPGWEVFPFEGNIQVKVLQAPELPKLPQQEWNATNRAIAKATAADGGTARL